jgi:hypothetical protein
MVNDKIMRTLLTLLAAITLASAALAEPRRCPETIYLHHHGGDWTIDIDAAGFVTASDPTRRVIHHGFLWRATGDLDWDD